MQASLEAEAKGKGESARQKKKLETQVNEIEIGLDHANRSNSELQKANKILYDIKVLNITVDNKGKRVFSNSDRVGGNNSHCAIMSG